MIIRQSKPEDLNEVMDIIKAAQEYFRDNKVPQWQNGYPDRSAILADMDKNSFYVMEEDKVLGIMAAIIGEEPTYNEIFEGSWLTSENSYITLHRVAVDMNRKGKGLGTQLFDFAEELARKEGLKSMRIDTHRKNKSMNRLIEKNGFKYCGIVYMTDGGERLAYEKLLNY